MNFNLAHLSFLFFIFISSFIQILFGINLASELFIVISPILFFIFLCHKNNYFPYYFYLIIFLLVVFLFLSFYPPIYDDEFCYPANLPKCFVKFGEYRISEFQTFWSSLYDSSIAISTTFYYFFDHFISLRLVNLITIGFILSIYFHLMNFLKIKIFIQLLFIASILLIPVFASHSIIIKNDLLGGYLLLSSYYFLIFCNSNNFINIKNYDFNYEKVIGLISIALITTIKPVFIIQAIPIIFYFFYLERQNFKKYFLLLLFLFSLFLFPWLYKNYLVFNQPLYPYLIIPFLEFKFLDFNNSDLSYFYLLLYEHHSTLKNYSIVSGNFMGFIGHITHRFGFLLYGIFFSLFFLPNKKYFYFTFFVLLNLFLFSFWEGRYWFGIIFIFIFIFIENFYYHKKYFFMLYIFLVILNVKDSLRAYGGMHFLPAYDYIVKGEEYFMNNRMNMMDNNNLISFINTNALNSNIVIDNCVLFYFDKSINAYSWNQLNLSPFTNVDYDKFIENLSNKNISYLIYAYDSYEKYIHFGFDKDNTINMKKYFSKNINHINQAEKDGYLKYINTFGRSSVYKVINNED